MTTIGTDRTALIPELDAGEIVDLIRNRHLARDEAIGVLKSYANAVASAGEVAAVKAAHESTMRVFDQVATRSTLIVATDDHAPKRGLIDIALDSYRQQGLPRK